MDDKFRLYGDIVHPIHWSARKLRHVARNSTTAEILAAAEATYMGLYLKAIVAELPQAPSVELTTDSRSLLALDTSIHEPEERLNKVDLAAIREVLEDANLNAVHWSPGPQLLADAVTKDNRGTALLLRTTLSSGKHERPLE